MFADPELWRFTPAQFARLTDWQIQWLYLHPAQERARKASPNPGPGVVDDPFADGLPPKAEFIAIMRQSDGGTADHWSTVYDRLEAEMTARGQTAE